MGVEVAADAGVGVGAAQEMNSNVAITLAQGQPHRAALRINSILLPDAIGAGSEACPCLESVMSITRQ